VDPGKRSATQALRFVGDVVGFEGRLSLARDAIAELASALAEDEFEDAMVAASVVRRTLAHLENELATGTAGPDARAKLRELQHQVAPLLAQAPAASDAAYQERFGGRLDTPRPRWNAEADRWRVQRKQRAPHDDDPAQVHAAASAGVAGASAPLPFLDIVQAAFGRHDISNVTSTIGGEAHGASTAIGASAYAIGDRVAFAQAPDLHTASHEAAHVVQQRHGVSVSGGIGQTGDPYEQHADAVADAVVAGRSAERLLDTMASGGGGGPAVQRDDKDAAKALVVEPQIRARLAAPVAATDVAAQRTRKLALVELFRSIASPERERLRHRLVDRSRGDSLVKLVYDRLDHQTVKELVDVLGGVVAAVPDAHVSDEMFGFLRQLDAASLHPSQNPVIVDSAWIQSKQIAITPSAKLGPPIALALQWSVTFFVPAPVLMPMVEGGQGTVQWDANKPAAAPFSFTIGAIGHYAIEVDVIANGLLVKHLSSQVEARPLAADHLADGLGNPAQIADVGAAVEVMDDPELGRQNTNLRSQMSTALANGKSGDHDKLGGALREVEWAQYEHGDKQPPPLAIRDWKSTNELVDDMPEEPVEMRRWLERYLASYGPWKFQDISMALHLGMAATFDEHTPRALKLRKAAREAGQLVAEGDALLGEFENTGATLMRDLLTVSKEATHHEMQHYGIELKLPPRTGPDRVAPPPATPPPAKKGPSERQVEVAILKETIQTLKTKKQELDAEAGPARVRQWQLFKHNPKGAWIDDPDADPHFHEMSTALATMWTDAIDAFPFLAGYKEGRDKDFAKLGDSNDPNQPMAMIYDETAEVLKNIAKAEEGLANGKFKVWSMAKLANMTKARLQIVPGTWRDKLIEEETHNRAVHDTWTGIFTGILTMGLALLSAAPSGGASIGAGIAVLALDAKAIYEGIEKYQYGKAAGKSSLDPAQSLTNEDPSLAWVVVDCVAAGLDAGQLVGTFKRAVKLRALAKAATESSPEVHELRDALNQIGRKHGLSYDLGEKVLRGSAAAGVETAAREGSTLGKLTRPEIEALGKKVGATVQIEEGLGAEIRVHYRIDKVTRAIEVVGIKAGEHANVGEILLHEGTVQLLERYNGTVGKIRRLWDDFKKMFGARGSVPFPPGSEAFNSWHELQKLPAIIEARQARLGSGVLAHDAEAALREDTAFLENELEHHKGIVEQASLEEGADFVASADKANKEAIAAGYPKPKSKAYYYVRSGKGAKNEFYLRRVSVKDAEPLRAEVVNGVPTGRFVKGELSRGEKAEELIKSWAEPTQKAFDAAKADAITKYGKELYDVVPVKGIAETDIKVGELLDRAATVEIERAFRKSLLAKGVENASAKARAMVEELADHQIRVIKGTDQLRAFGYRAAHLKGAEAVGDLHHWLPLYLGGDHRALVDMIADEHTALHRVMDSLEAAGVTLAPGSIHSAPGLNFTEGAAILFTNGAIDFVHL
jgi:hypothetical protein